MFSNPFVCGNPSAQCDAAPSLTQWNQRLGCLSLNGHHADGECLPHTCPPVPCGNVCPPVCPDNIPFHKCAQWEGTQSRTHSCADYVMGGLYRMIAETPMVGCTGPCRAVNSSKEAEWTAATSGGSGCCTNQTTPYIPYTDYTTMPDMFRRFHITTTSSVDDGAVGAIAMYNKYLNFISNCITQTCACPSSVAGHMCSGQGACTWEGDTSFACVCNSGYSGPDCSVKATTAMCALGFNSQKGKPLPCTSPANGTCTTTDKSAKTTIYACVCKPGWSGSACNIKSCPVGHDGDLCSGNGTCMPASGICVCAPGYSGKACECATDSSGNDTCVSGSTGEPVTTASTSTSSTSPGTTSNPSSSPSSSSTTSDTAVLIGVLAGGVLMLILFAALMYKLWHHHDAGLDIPPSPRSDMKGVLPEQPQ